MSVEVKRYTRPRIIMIGRSRETESLYTAERRRNDAVQAAAKKLAAVLGHAPGEYWTRTIPQALFDTLESFQREAAYLAAREFVRSVEQRWPEMVTETVVVEG